MNFIDSNTYKNSVISEINLQNIYSHPSLLFINFVRNLLNYLC